VTCFVLRSERDGFGVGHLAPNRVDAPTPIRRPISAAESTNKLTPIASDDQRLHPLSAPNLAARRRRRPAQPSKNASHTGEPRRTRTDLHNAKRSGPQLRSHVGLLYPVGATLWPAPPAPPFPTSTGYSSGLAARRSTRPAGKRPTPSPTVCTPRRSSRGQVSDDPTLRNDPSHPPGWRTRLAMSATRYLPRSGSGGRTGRS
jgi:hypothetical protein